MNTSKTMNLKNQMRGLDVQSAGRSESGSTPGAKMDFKQLIAQSGMDLKQRVKELESELTTFRELDEAGRAEHDIPIDLIDRPGITMRSDSYWTSARFREIKSSILNNGLRDPISVRRSDVPGRFILIKGDTRLTSYGELLDETGDQKFAAIRARIENLDEVNSVLAMVIENRDREDVWAYDQAIFCRRVLDEIFSGDRQAVMSLLDVSESWLSKNITVASIPESLMDAYPILYQAGILSLYPLAKSVEVHANQLDDLIARAETLTETSPARQSTRLQREIESKSRRPTPPGAAQSVRASDGKVLAEVKQSRQYHNLRIDNRAMPGFGEFVEKRLADLHAEWQKHLSGSQGDEAKER